MNIRTNIVDLKRMLVAGFCLETNAEGYRWLHCEEGAGEAFPVLIAEMHLISQPTPYIAHTGGPTLQLSGQIPSMSPYITVSNASGIVWNMGSGGWTLPAFTPFYWAEFNEEDWAEAMEAFRGNQS